MKIKCDFCKTEYSVDKAPSAPVKCAVCGYVWNTTVAPKKNAWLMFFASVCALLSAIIFTIAVITHHQIKNANRGPLIASVNNISTITDESGVAHIVVNGTVTNISSNIYGVPDLLIVSTDEKGNVLAKQKFMPSATLLDAGASVNFSHVLAQQPNGVKKISAHLLNLEIPQDKK
ncbi:MAG: hypothetical protein J6R99_01305 [Alphaproteobacteria bacterium]|nr:hypothetical protein [Alphaproteobacteria bacterium]